VIYQSQNDFAASVTGLTELMRPREVTPENGKSAFLRCGKLPETYRFATT
jgi:hypothetical protein